DPNFLIGVLTELQKEQAKNKVLTEKIEADKPLTEFAEAVGRSRNAILIGDLAKLLRQNGIDTGQKRLFAWLRDNDYLISRKGSSHNMPEQWAMESGLFIIKESVVKFSDGTEHTRKTTMVTGKGQLYFINLFCGSDDEEDEDGDELLVGFLESDD
ncbi:MAG: phage antirepressor KilAC domain-containing protein, partial [Oscillospiraceae bacterium]|nr:phage antirepressor KilAC domain-containing protein [Oscillospiraceae bacterium]